MAAVGPVEGPEERSGQFKSPASGPRGAGPGRPPGQPDAGEQGPLGLCDPSVPVVYRVDRTRDGKSFSVRSVKAIQHGYPILICQASFEKKMESPIQHQFTMPVVPAPENVLTRGELIEKYLRDPDLMENYKMGLTKILAEEVPIEIKPINPPDCYRRVPMEPVQRFWVRARGYIGDGDMKLHCCVAAYISDYSFLRTTASLAVQGKIHSIPQPLHVVPCSFQVG